MAIKKIFTDRAAFPVSNPRTVGIEDLLRLSLDYPRAGGDIAGNPDVAAYLGAAPYGDAPQERRTGIDDDIVLDDGVPRYSLDGLSQPVQGKGLGPEGAALVDPYVFPDDAGLADNGAGAMVDEESLAYRRPRVYVDAGGGMGHLGDDPRDKIHIKQVQFMGDAVIGERRHAGITENGLTYPPCGRVPPVSRLGVQGKESPYLRQRSQELARLDPGPGVAVDTAGLLPPGAGEAFPAAYLFR